MTSSPTFVGTPKVWSASIHSAVTVGNWLPLRDVLTNTSGALGAKVTSITAVSTDATARVVSVGIGRAIAQSAGATAATLAITLAAPSVVTVTNGHNLVGGDQIAFYNGTSGTFPSGLTQGNTAYVNATSVTNTAFSFAATAGGANIGLASNTNSNLVMGAIRYLGSATVPTSSGTDGVNTGLNILSNALLPGIPVDNDGNPYIFLEKDDFLCVSAPVAPTANKIISIQAMGGTF